MKIEKKMDNSTREIRGEYWLVQFEPPIEGAFPKIVLFNRWDRVSVNLLKTPRNNSWDDLRCKLYMFADVGSNFDVHLRNIGYRPIEGRVVTLTKSSGVEELKAVWFWSP